MSSAPSPRLHSLPLLGSGKVRDNYAVGEDRLLMVTSDRLSAFDVIMAEPIPDKGRVLNTLALFWFDKLKHVVPNHLTGEAPESVVQPDEIPLVQGRSMLVKRLKPILVEAVVRGYLVGSGYKEYLAEGSVSGIALPPGIDSITLPAYRKQPDGNYTARALDMPLEQLVALRSQTILAALTAFAPQLLIVDNVPRGALAELDTVLPTMRARGTHIVLGLRDIIDTPEAVARQWERQKNADILRRCFDAVWIYGDPRVYDTISAYGLDRLESIEVTPVGYLDPNQRWEARSDTGGTASDGTVAETSDAPYALCMMGGGQDGLAVAEAFARAPLPSGWRGIILTGSMMPAEARQRLQALADARPELQLLPFVAEPLTLIRNARAVVAMAGYNSTMEVLALGKRTLLVPRVTPRAEQWLRASRLAELGLVGCLHPNELDPARVGAWLAEAANPAPAVSALQALDFGGLRRVAELAAQLLGTPSPVARVPSAA